MFEYLDFEIVDDFFKPHAIIRKKNTSLKIKDDKKNLYDYGVFIDVFPLDKVSVEKKQVKKQSKKINFYKKVVYYKTSYTVPKNIFKRAIKKVLVLFLGLFKLKKIYRKQLIWMTKYNASNSNLLCNFAGKYRIEKESHDISIWGRPKLYSFENRQYCGPENADAYLKKIYGDYMKLPSVEEQNMFLEFFENLKIEEVTK